MGHLRIYMFARLLRFRDYISGAKAKEKHEHFDFVDYRSMMLEMKQQALDKKIAEIQNKLVLFLKNEEQAYMKFLLLEANSDVANKNLREVRELLLILNKTDDVKKEITHE